MLFSFLFFSPGIVFSANEQAVQLIEKAERLLQEGQLLRAKVYIGQAKSLAINLPQITETEKKLDIAVKEKIEKLQGSAKFLADSKRVSEAIKEYRSILNFDPDNSEAKKALAKLEEMRSLVEKFQEIGVDVNPQTGLSEDLAAYSKLDLLLKSKKALRMGYFQKALDLVTELLSKNPESIEAIELKNNITEAIKNNEILENAENNLRSGKFREALDFLNLSIANDPERIDLYFKRGIALMKISNFQSAISDLEKVLLWKPSEKSYYKTNPINSETVLVNLAYCYFEIGRPRESYALIFDPNSGAVLKGLDFQLDCIYRAFKFSCMVLIGAFLFFLLSLYVFFKGINAILDIHSFFSIKPFLSWLLKSVYRGEVSRDEDLQTLSLSMKIPWLSYTAGLIFLEDGLTKKAQEHFQFALNSDFIAPRAHFFLGISRKDGGNNNSDFEQTVVSGLKVGCSTFLPGFVKKLEMELLKKNFNQDLPSGSFEKLAWTIIEKLSLSS
ncbi:MAG: hypothetical protein HQM08_13175 [Candidatus Riflebacteria bacterium]|nr:hypothetical protein [Candidatus Riflebacteria bacterium]